MYVVAKAIKIAASLNEDKTVLPAPNNYVHCKYIMVTDFIRLSGLELFTRSMSTAAIANDNN